MSIWQWLVLFQHELLLFSAVFFLIGFVDDIAVDVIWLLGRLSGRIKSLTINRSDFSGVSLSCAVAVFIPAWQEDQVIGSMIRHVLNAWPQKELTLYVGCYQNDPATIDAAISAAAGDDRLRLVINGRDGPTTKAECLNRLFLALCADERRYGQKIRMVVFHDAEDLVDPAAIGLLDQAIDHAQFVQLPVLPLPQESSQWIGNHYCEEFAEAHGKSMVVRAQLGAALPAAGVGCAIARDSLEQLANANDGKRPFAEDSLTEDYEMGLKIAEMGGRCQFLRARGEDGRLIATRAYFPSRLGHVLRQKSRWVHGISLQGWERMGWSRRHQSNYARLVEIWMRIRDRRGPFGALVLLAGYALVPVTAFIWLASLFGLAEPLQLSNTLKILLGINLFALCWRIAFRFAFTAREFGNAEGLRAILRLPLANLVTVLATARALFAYAKTLMGGRVIWDKTPHSMHPAQSISKAQTG